MDNFLFYKCLLKRCELGIGGTPSLQGKGALVELLDADSQESRYFIFAHTRKQLLYYHEYAMPPHDGMYVLRVANNRVSEYTGENFEVITEVVHPYVYVVVDTAPSEPLIAIENCKYCKRAKDEVLQVLDYSLHRDLSNVGWNVKLVPCVPSSKQQARLHQMMAVVNDLPNAERTLENRYGIQRVDLLIRHFLRYRESLRGKRKSHDLRNYILHHNKDLVLKLLDGVLRNLKGSKSVSCPFRFLQDHKVMKRPPFNAVINQFPYLKDRVTVSRFNEYTNENNNPYAKDGDLYDVYRAYFADIIE